MDLNILEKKTKRKQPIICKRCGKRIGFVTIKTRFNIKMMIVAFWMIWITQFLTQLAAEYILLKPILAKASLFVIIGNAVIFTLSTFLLFVVLLKLTEYILKKL